MTPAVRLGVVRDFRAEGWPSMDLVADQLLAQWGPVAHAPGSEIVATDLAPPYRRLLAWLPRVGRNADRLLNRHVFLPRFLRRVAPQFDLFHVVDHSYAHVVSALPPGRAGVYCHDLNAFRCLLEPDRDPRPWWFRRIAARILGGFRRAAVVFHSTAAVREELVRHKLVDPARLIHAPYGVAAEFTPTAAPVELPLRLDEPYLLHVGGNVPRKRLDVLLEVFAAVRTQMPDLRLVQVGGPWPAPQREQIARLGIGEQVTQVRDLSREQLAELYRRAAVVLMPSEAEGFGLPVIEALACGAVVVASDIPPLREAGGSAAVYAPVADVPAWAAAVRRVLTQPETVPPRDSRLSHASRYSWREHARIIGEAYLSLERGPLARPS
jgi:glycosyltransferase involved in cell wall biosynthesis